MEELTTAVPTAAAPAADAPAAVAPAIAWRDVTFAYPAAPGEEARPVLEGATACVGEGEFCLLTGGTGAGKTTLLRLAKPEVAPAGERAGSVEAFGREVAGLSSAESASLVGYVAQVPSTQIVCDSVWHELAFGLESLGCDPAEMHRRVAEVCYFLGAERLFRRRTDELSGGEQQLVALASVLAMEPRLLLLDEPTSMLDPIARDGFAHALFRLNRELGITVVVATHEPWALAPYATSAIRVADGRAERVPVEEVSREPGLLSADRIDAGARPDRAARLDADPDARSADVSADKNRSSRPRRDRDALRLSDVWQRYDRGDPWVLEDCSLRCEPGMVHALVGGNGSGKSTLLRVAAGVLRVRRGRVANACLDAQALLPQDPESLLACASVGEELMAWSDLAGYGEAEATAMAERLGLSGLGARDPMDLSRGQRQLVALAKVLLVRPRLLLADEPTLGLDAPSRRVVARALRELADDGAAVLMATHDLTLAREVSDETSMVFDGGVTCTLPTAEFFERNVFYR